jgi:muramoyltetrapeptide carboxypeptidase
MKEITPLMKGDTLVIISPAKAIPKRFIELAVGVFESWGLKVEVGQNALGEHHYFSGKDEERISDLQWALNHSTAKAIVTSRGGYGSIRIVDEVDYSFFMKNPKWMVGFSDVSIFHNKWHGSLGFPSIHAVAPLYFDQLGLESEPLETLRKALFAEALNTRVGHHVCNRLGEAKGLLVGGNLAILESLIGTSLDITIKGKILFLEEVSEYAYKFDRMLWSLEKSGKFEGLAGLVVGGLTDMKSSNETFGCSIEELVQEVVKGYDFPVMFNYPAGHQLDNRALVLGGQYSMRVESFGASLNRVIDG